MLKNIEINKNIIILCEHQDQKLGISVIKKLIIYPNRKQCLYDKLLLFGDKKIWKKSV